MAMSSTRLTLRARCGRRARATECMRSCCKLPRRLEALVYTCPLERLCGTHQQKVNRNKGRKKGAGHKTNIRQAPYYIQDGDLIGLKILSEDKGFLEPGDFSTQEDIEKRQLLQQIAEEKKR
ncbi:ubiquitin carboxyl-terminal hydrolase 40, partial [Elysia marginata]